MERVAVPTRTMGPPPHRRRLFRFESTAQSHPGAVRDNNEDFAFAGENLIAVADGVGGNVFGEVASEVVVAAISYLEDRIYIHAPDIEIKDAARYANYRLICAIHEDGSLSGMATTLTALRLDGSSVMVLHIGDSRAYSLRGDEWQRLTRDDSLVQGLVDSGAITAAEARRHPARSIVVQALNGGPVDPHVTTHDVMAGDRFLVCSDGLTDYVDEESIRRIVSSCADPQTCSAALVEAALEVGAPDNVSCVVADVTPLDPPSAAGGELRRQGDSAA
jgi:serine/threonine protein phosphatase PrpC